MRKPIRMVVTLMVVISLLLVIAPTKKVKAAFPGYSGKLSWSRLNNIWIPDSGTSEIVASNLDGSDLQILTQHSFGGSGSFSGAPRYSADGQKITYTLKNPNNLSSSDIIVANADGTGQQNITNINPDDFPDRNGYLAVFSSFSPDGSKVVYGERWEENDSRTRIVIANIDGSNKQEVVSPNSSSTVMYPVFSPDGSKIAFYRADKNNDTRGIFTINTNGSDLNEVVRLHNDEVLSHPNPFQFVLPIDNEGATTFDWSPDSQRIVYIQHDSFGGDNTEQFKIRVTDLLGNFQTIYEKDMINDSGYLLLAPQFTPEGNVLFAQTQANMTESSIEGTSGVYTMDTAGNNLQAIPSTLKSITDLQGLYTALYDYLLPTIQPTSLPPSSNMLNVLTYPDPITSSTVTLELPGDVTNGTVSAISPSSIPKDTFFSYPLGLTSFQFDTTIGATKTVTLYYDLPGDPSSYTARKYNTNTKTFSTITNATITRVTYNNKSMIRLTYDITDGGPLDQDNTVNGTIVDPVGLAQATVGVPDTGL